MISQDLKKHKLPSEPGVYLFKAGKEVLYIGKATSLKDRVKSYFSKDLISTRGQFLVDMVFKATKVDYIKTDSVLEAIILESNLIKKHQPKYNTKEKDDKSFNYVVITKEDWPRVSIKRGHDMFQSQERYQKFSESTDIFLLKNSSCSRQSRSQVSHQTSDTFLAHFGPFTNASQLKEAIKIIRKIFPFRDRCLPAEEGGLQKPCFNKQISLCPGVCDGTISKKDYKKIIRNIILFFEGKKKQIIRKLEKEMKACAKSHEFEKAGRIRNKIFALGHIRDVALIKDTTPSSEEHPSLEKEGKGEVLLSPPWLRRSTESARGGGLRIEAYDVAHLSGTNNVGVMVVMEKGEFIKSDYRKFKINNSKGNDIGALKEILGRRLKHTEWPLPDYIVVDGGLGQFNVAKGLVGQIPLFAVTKDEKHKPKGIIGDESLIAKSLTTQAGKKEILQINAEAHRFAIAFHRQKRSAII